MEGLKGLWPVFPMTIAGGVIGYIAGFAWEKYLKADKPLLFAVLGGTIGFFCLPTYRWLVSDGKELNLESVDVKVPLVGTLKVKISDAHRIVAWKLFIELSTRVTSQPLAAGEGIIRDALDSLHRLFDIVRAELKSMTPSPIPVTQGTYTVESYAVRMLNDGLRPMLRRWHPRLMKWEKRNLAESDWPLAEYCRADLEKTRQIVLAYTWGLAEMLKVAELVNLLPPKPQGQKPELTSADLLRGLESEFDAKVSDAQRTAGWRIVVELTSRIATQPLEAQTGLISEALSSLKALFDVIRTELKQIPPPPPSASAAQPAKESVEAIAMSILNSHLRSFLDKWHPQLLKWEKENPDKTEAEWSEIDNCRNELEALREKIIAEAKMLSKLIGVKYLEVGSH